MMMTVTPTPAGMTGYVQTAITPIPVPAAAALVVKTAKVTTMCILLGPQTGKIYKSTWP